MERALKRFANGKGMLNKQKKTSFCCEYFAEGIFVSSLWGKTTEIYFSGPGCQAAQFVNVHHALVNVVRQARLTFDLQRETAHRPALLVPDKRPHECR